MHDLRRPPVALPGVRYRTRCLRPRAEALRAGTALSLALVLSAEYRVGWLLLLIDAEQLGVVVMKARLDRYRP